MKLKLLLGTLMFAAITAHAQVATINENFNSFTPGQGQTVFPQNQWTAIYPDAVGNPAPMMNIVVNNATDNFVQAYSGANQNSPEYLISPQIVAPAGDKTLTFKARRNTGSAPGSIQVGLASNPTDMSTFVALANATILTSDTFQTISIPVTASTSQYIVFKFVGALAPHTVLEIDDVVYNQASSLAVSDQIKSKEEIRFAVNADHTALEFIAKKDPKNIHVYSAAGQKVAEGKLSGRSFDISRLQTGVYYILIETAEGSVIKSKFIKK
ncbi:Por secretion system C-terminal sorting domain-containing protein [Chryseobacterium taichungense]|uniref:Por secretion system C-terminal sorting domain-containing protein n=1 Tax=Chryseobacterium taichungense TaxID=295069 RepID=A0A1H8DF60_9FLAO|nr:choice-of-anchor J domain-containing protein [Chryseobacterium taichungense]SEN05923.1 Por secretion system C-terminal sorting domain-containing protein [Chryseobacterium taichungense]